VNARNGFNNKQTQKTNKQTNFSFTNIKIRYPEVSLSTNTFIRRVGDIAKSDHSGPMTYELNSFARAGGNSSW
jgi:hypothetical protein